jgi:hypothetical protein
MRRWLLTTPCQETGEARRHGSFTCSPGLYRALDKGESLAMIRNVALAGGKIDRLRDLLANDYPFAAGLSHSRRSANHFGGADGP